MKAGIGALFLLPSIWHRVTRLCFLPARQPDEGFYTCDWTLDDASGEHILAVAGKLGIIHLLR